MQARKTAVNDRNEEQYRKGPGDWQWNRLLSLLLTMTIMFAAGCGGVKPEITSSPPADDKPVTLQKGGRLVYGSMQEPDTLNPLFSDLVATAEVSSLIFSGLVKRSANGEWLPDLVREVPTTANGGVSPDGLTVTYRLRSGVPWHDGAPFNAEDVRFTWQLIMNRQAHIASRDGYDKISRIDTPDPYTVVVRFSEVYPGYLSLFPSILPRHILGVAPDLNKAPFNRNPVGTGPFRFKEWRVAEAVILDANPSYFQGKPLLDGITYKVTPDVAILMNQLKSGDVDIVGNINFAQLEQVRGMNGIKVTVTPNMLWEHLDFNLDLPLFQDVKVRRAISLGIDRAAITSGLLKNIATPVAGDQALISWAFNPILRVPSRDVEAARALLLEAGWKPGADGIFVKDRQKLAFTLMTNANNKIRGLVAQNIAQQLKEIGIAVEVRPVDATAFFDDFLKNRRFEMAMYAWVLGNDPDDYSLWNSRRIPGRYSPDGQNYPGWRNAEVDKLTAQALTATNMEARKQMYYRIQDILAEECPAIPLYFHGNIDAAKKRVVHFQPNPTAAGNLWNAWQWGLAVEENKNR
ncbi:MAG TPA: peptide ABC transporter substrate-binding protein [Patescibacteria group bacterium]|nr:peptide ABC transporter substrate-binding protein [Patescibacteria group bacterium]